MGAVHQLQGQVLGQVMVGGLACHPGYGEKAIVTSTHAMHEINLDASTFKPWHTTNIDNIDACLEDFPLFRTEGFAGSFLNCVSGQCITVLLNARGDRALRCPPPLETNGTSCVGWPTRIGCVREKQMPSIVELPGPGWRMLVPEVSHDTVQGWWALHKDHPSPVRLHVILGSRAIAFPQTRRYSLGLGVGQDKQSRVHHVARSLNGGVDEMMVVSPSGNLLHVWSAPSGGQEFEYVGSLQLSEEKHWVSTCLMNGHLYAVTTSGEMWRFNLPVKA